MEVLTTALVVTKLWAAFELIGAGVLQGFARGAASLLGEQFTSAVAEKTGLRDKQRHKAFVTAYHDAEEKLIGKIGIAAAYRTFRQFSSLADSPNTCEKLLLIMLEQQGSIQSSPNIDPYRSIVQFTNQDLERVAQFLLFLRWALYDTIEFRSVVEFCNQEISRQSLQLIARDLEQLTRTIDHEMRAVRVMVVEPSDFDQERAIYLGQIAAVFEEQDFVGFPDLQERRQPVLLRDIFVPLRLTGESSEQETSGSSAQ